MRATRARTASSSSAVGVRARSATRGSGPARHTSIRWMSPGRVRRPSRSSAADCCPARRASSSEIVRTSRTPPNAITPTAVLCLPPGLTRGPVPAAERQGDRPCRDPLELGPSEQHGRSVGRVNGYWVSNRFGGWARRRRGSAYATFSKPDQGAAPESRDAYVASRGKVVSVDTSAVLYAVASTGYDATPLRPPTRLVGMRAGAARKAAPLHGRELVCPSGRGRPSDALLRVGS